jgi:hypothetical protein
VLVLDLPNTDLLHDPGAYEQLLALLGEDHPQGCTVRGL